MEHLHAAPRRIEGVKVQTRNVETMFERNAPYEEKKHPALKLPTVLTNLGEDGLNPSCFCCLRLLLKASGADGGERGAPGS